MRPTHASNIKTAAGAQMACTEMAAQDAHRKEHALLSKDTAPQKAIGKSLVAEASARAAGRGSEVRGFGGSASEGANDSRESHPICLKVWHAGESIDALGNPTMRACRCQSTTLHLSPR
jgi:hypothetical protein